MQQVRLKSLKDLDIKGKRVLVRADFNVPLDMEGAYRPVDDSRLRAAVPTLDYLHQAGAAQITIITHIGRPGGNVEEGLRTAPVAEHLRTLTQVPFELKENLRFDPREEAADPAFAKELAALGDVYVNEAFPVSHRNDASITELPKLLPSAAGLRFEEEVARLSEALEPPHPALALIGGAKFETKEPLLAKLSEHYDKVLVGGVLGNDLLKSRGWPVGRSLVGSSIAPTALANNAKLIMPEDLTVAREGSTPVSGARQANTGDIRAQEMIVDIGPRTIEAWSKEVAAAQFVMWNGPMGWYEHGYRAGTEVLAKALANSGARAVVGGGDTAAALKKVSFDANKVYLSTGGGAMLQFLTDGTLPGIEPLRK
jgi:phosphoglycerate kinase